MVEWNHVSVACWSDISHEEYENDGMSLKKLDKGSCFGTSVGLGGRRGRKREGGR